MYTLFVRLVFLLGGMLFAVIVAVLVWAALRPSEYRVERVVQMKAPPERVYALLDDVRRWPDWQLDERNPKLQRRYFGPPRGAGSGFDWTGDIHTGQGRATIAEAVAPQRLKVLISVKEPQDYQRTIEIALSPSGGGTELRWADYGPMSYFTKVTITFTSMDAVMGPKLDSSLANLKSLAEG